MPLYEYQCRDCGHRFEILQRIGEGAEGLVCPSCGEKRLDNQLSTFASGAGSSSMAAPAGGGGCGGGSGFT